MSMLGDNLKNAASYEVAKTSKVRFILMDDGDVDAIAAAVVAIVLEELASREQMTLEATVRDETSNTRTECVVRVHEYTEAANDLRGE